MDEETKKVLKELEIRIDALESELSELKNHKHDSNGYATGNY
jgi:hypothetical protein